MCGSGPGTLRIVEDQAVIAVDLAERLTSNGYAVCGIAASGEEALSLARAFRPALVLMDIRLQGEMDGIEAAEILRREQGLPVIFLSAHCDEHIFLRAKIVDAYGFLIKPFDDRELQINIEVALHRHESERQLAAAHAEIQRANQRLQALALYDPLTGLANRRKFIDCFDHETARTARNGECLSILIIDIDHFKVINDRHGHHMGDICLKALAVVLRDCTRTVDLVARFGGDEFIILLPDTPLDEAMLVGERMRRETETYPVAVLDGMPLHITISVGVTAVNGDAEKFEQVLIRVDKALYGAKYGGRNQTCIQAMMP